LDNYFVTLVVYGTNLFACNGKLFYKPPNYYPETLYPLVTASIGGVKTIRTLRSDAPFTVSDMKSSYLPDEAISRLGQGCSAPVSMLSLLLNKLKLELPAQPPPKITASAPPPPTPL